MLSLSQLREKIRAIDLIILLTIFGVLQLPNWGEWQVLKPLVTFSFLTIYFFEIDPRKTTSWLLVFTVAAFFLSFGRESFFVPYSTYGIVQFGLFSWVAVKVRAKDKMSPLWWLFGGAIFFASTILSLGVLLKEEELQLFLLLQAGISYLPLIVEREKLSEDAGVWRLCSFQQVVSRSFLVFWAIKYHYEINAMAFFSDYSMILVAGMLFLPFLALVNWDNIKWDYLHESFISLLGMYALISAQKQVQLAVAILVFGGATISINKMIFSNGNQLQNIIRSLESGGFGGFSFFLTLGIALAVHGDKNKIAFPLILFVIFTFAWASFSRQRGGGEKPLEKKAVFGRAFFQASSPLWFLWLYGWLGL